MFHIKCVLFRQCNQYGINSISVKDASLWIHIQESEFSAYDEVWMHPYISMYLHFLRKQLFNLADTVDMIFYRVNCIGQAESLKWNFTAKLPKIWSMFKNACIFIEKLKFGHRRSDCSIKMEMRYRSILFDHTSVDTSSNMAGFHIGPLY